MESEDKARVTFWGIFMSGIVAIVMCISVTCYSAAEIEAKAKVEVLTRKVKEVDSCREANTSCVRAIEEVAKQENACRSFLTIGGK